MITIRSINGEVLTHFDNDVPNGNPYFEPVMTDDMESLVSSFSFSVPLQLADTEYLTGMNQVLTYDRQGDLRLFIISDVYEDWNTTNGVVKVDCEDVSITEMNNIVVNPFEAKDFNEALTKTFKNSGWKFKYAANWKEVVHDTFILEDYTNMRDVLAQLKDTYECQFKFMAQENEYGEITRVVEVFKSVGNNNGKYFYYNRDLLGIERDISFTDVKTAIHPYYVGYNGKVYTLANFAPAHPDPDFSKDKESPLIVNKSAHAEYDDGNSYRIMPYKTEVQGDPELVYREAIEELKKHAEPIYTYTVNALLLQNMIEWEGEDIDLGDTVWMKERVGNRELGLEARVVAYEYHEDDPSADKVTFSNFKEIDTRDVEELSNRIFFAYANSADGHLDFSTDDSVGKAYMGVYTSTVTQQSTDPDTYKWTRIKGEDGNSAPTLSLTASQQVMKFKPDGTPDGDQTILFTAVKQNSTEVVEWEAIPFKGDTEQPAITLEGTGDTRTLSSANWDKTWTRVQVTITMGALKDIQTVVQVADGATGADGKAIVGFVTNESTTFAASTVGTVSDYTQGSGKFVIYEGTKEVTSGVLYAKESNVGINLVIDATTGEYTVANMTQDQAQAVVKATYKGVTITKFLSFAKSKQGAKGDKGDTGRDGIAGKDGVGLRSTAVTYAASTSGTIAPSTGWQAQVPTVAPNNFLWTRTVWTYSDSTSETGYSVAKMGKDGAKGDDGIAGKDGVGIDDTLIEYSVSTSGTTKPTSGWSTTIPTVPQGQYLWTRTTWTYTDKTTEQGFTVARQGEKGDKGDQGIAGPKGADGRTQYTHIAYADTASGGGFSQSPANKNYIGMYVDFEEIDSTNPSKYAWSLIKGADGEQGVAGPKGEDGRTPYFHTAYINSTDFGAYDYSGNPNLMRVIKASDFNKESDVSVSDIGYNSIRLTSQGVNRLSAYTSNNIPSLVSGKTYTISAKVKIEEGTTGNIDKLRVSYRKVNGGTMLLSANTKDAEVGKEITIKATGTVNYEITDLAKFYLTIDTEVGAKINGSVIVSDIKIEEGSTATPYQPNLLDAPWYFSTVPLGENIANKDIQFPIKSSEYLLYKANMEEEYVIGQTYTVTIKGTKPASQTFIAYNDGTISFGNLKPVEGLTDVWSLTFTPTKLAVGKNKEFRIFQYPSSTVGACQIDWLKIEKGDTRTPNIDNYKYLGNYTDFVQADSLNPTKYSWSLIKGTDGETSHVHTAYAWSADGTDRFTKVYPQVNMLENTKNPISSKPVRVKGSAHSNTDVLTFQNGITHHERKTTPANGEMYYRFMSTADGNLASTNLVKGETYYFGLDLRAELAEGDYVTWRAQYKNPTSSWIDLDGWKTGVSKIEGVTSEFKRFEKALTIPKDAVTLYFSYQVYPKSGTGVATGSIVEFKNAKFALKSATPYTPTPEEDYENAYPAYTGTYSDFNVEGSDNPKDYAWVRSMGSDGTPAKLLSLQADSYVMKFDTNGNIISGQTISLSAIVQNMSGTTTWLATPYIGTAAQPPLTLTGSGNTRTLSGSQWGKTVTKVVVKVTLGDFEDTIIINKLQDGAKGQDGADGRDGVAGKDGVGLKSTAITYAGSANGTTPPSTGWQEQVPTVPAGQFLWTRTIWTYTDNSNETGYSVAKMGQDGAKGNDGIAGKDGVGIKTTVIEYAVNTSGTTRPTSGWSTSIPTVPQGQYLWTRTTWTYTDNTTEQGFTVARQGSNGANGTNGTNGANAISAFLSNETVSLPANAAGVVSSFATARGTMMVYEGLTRVTSGVTFALGAHNNTTATVDASGNFAVTAMTADSATVVINATYKGTTISKTFSLSKAKQGAQGVQGTMGIAFYSPTEPTGATVTDGATWFKTKSATDDTVIGIYTRKSGAWKQTPLASGTLAVEQLSAISANIGNVTAGNLTGVKITGASFINPFDFTDQTNNHIQGTTEISNSELDISGTANAGTAGERKFHTTVAPLYFEATYSDAADNLIRSLNMSSSGFILNEVGNRVTTSLSSGQFQSIDSANGKSVITSTNNISITDSKNTAIMSPSGFVFRNRKNIHLWQGTGTVLKTLPNLGRITFGTYQSVGWGMLNEDIPLRVHNSYTWQATRKIKLEVIAQINTQDSTSDWVYFTAQSGMTTATDKSPRQIITIGRISATKDSGDIRIPLQNTTLCTGYFELNEGEYLSLCGNCREGKHCGNVNGMSVTFREIFST